MRRRVRNAGAGAAAIAAVGAIAIVATQDDDGGSTPALRAERPVVLSTAGYRELSDGAPRLAEQRSKRLAERWARERRAERAERAAARERARERAHARAHARAAAPDPAPAPSTPDPEPTQTLTARTPSDGAARSAPERTQPTQQSTAPRERSASSEANGQREREQAPQPGGTGESGAPPAGSQTASWGDGAEGAATPNGARPRFVAQNGGGTAGVTIDAGVVELEVPPAGAGQQPKVNLPGSRTAELKDGEAR